MQEPGYGVPNTHVSVNVNVYCQQKLICYIKIIINCIWFPFTTTVLSIIQGCPKFDCLRTFSNALECSTLKIIFASFSKHRLFF